MDDDDSAIALYDRKIFGIIEKKLYHKSSIHLINTYFDNIILSYISCCNQ
jgi:hypothetical protein